jgi:hypothetical protein
MDMKRLPAAIAAASFVLAACSAGGNAVTPSWPSANSVRADVTTPLAIYDNLGKGRHVYRCCIAWTIGGAKSKIGKQWLAAPFVPAAARSATKVSLALTWSTGPNHALQVALATDVRNHPGKELWHARIAPGLPTFNHCCTLQTIALAKPVALTAGVRYWIVVRTTPSALKTVDNWQNNITGAGGLISTNNGKGWGDAKLGTGLPAFAVYGK